MSKSQSRIFAADCAAQGLPEPLPEGRFHPSRMWRFDYCWPLYRVALEVEGGIHMAHRTGHTSIAGIKRDIDKGNEAIRLGWYVLRVLPENLMKHETYALLRDVLINRGWRPQA